MTKSSNGTSHPWDDDEHPTFGHADEHGEASSPLASSAHDAHAAPAYDLGWGDAAWAEAGGFDAVLVGHLLGDHGGGNPSIVVIPIEHLEVNYNTLFETTQIFLNASNGGSIQVGGSVDAESNQGLLGAPLGHQAFAGGPAAHADHDTSATNNVAVYAGNGDGNYIGGNVIGFAEQRMDHDSAY